MRESNQTPKVMKTVKATELYRIKEEYLWMVVKYAMNTSLDIYKAYDKQTWIKNGFKESILKKV